MALKVGIFKQEEVALWRTYEHKDTDDKGEEVILGSLKFKIRGSAHKAYQVALERAHNQIASKGFDVTKVREGDLTHSELIIQATAHHLVADWEGVVFLESGEEKEVSFSAENAHKLFVEGGELGAILWAFVRTEADKIQADADKQKNETLGKSLNYTSGKQATTAKRTSKKNSSKPLE